MKQVCLADSLNYLFIQTAKAHRTCMGEYLAELDLYPGQEMILVTLWAEDGLSLSQVAERLEIQPPTVSKMVQRMEATGIIQRKMSPDDSRVWFIFLTSKGRGLQSEIARLWQKVEAQLIEDLSKTEVASFKVLLRKARENLNGK